MNAILPLLQYKYTDLNEIIYVSILIKSKSQLTILFVRQKISCIVFDWMVFLKLRLEQLHVERIKKTHDVFNRGHVRASRGQYYITELHAACTRNACSGFDTSTTNYKRYILELYLLCFYMYKLWFIAQLSLSVIVSHVLHTYL